MEQPQQQDSRPQLVQGSWPLRLALQAVRLVQAVQLVQALQVVQARQVVAQALPVAALQAGPVLQPGLAERL